MKYKRDFYYILYSELPFEEKKLYFQEIKGFVKSIAWEYCGFWTWYDNLFTTNLELDSTREILICHTGLQVAGIAILKNDMTEKKICTLRVAKEYQKRGIGKQLMEQSFEWLENDKPLITVHKSKSKEFDSLFNRYGFILEEKQKNYYHLFNTELVFNGTLPAKSFVLSSKELCDLEILIREFCRSNQTDLKMLYEKYIQQYWAKKQLREQIIMNY